MKKRVYIIAKVTGLPISEVMEKYEKAKSIIRESGHYPVSPVDHVPQGSDWVTAMRICIPLMLSCDYITAIDDVNTTAGGLVEYTIAGWLKIPRLYFSSL